MHTEFQPMCASFLPSLADKSIRQRELLPASLSGIHIIQCVVAYLCLLL